MAPIVPKGFPLDRARFSTKQVELDNENGSWYTVSDGQLAFILHKDMENFLNNALLSPKGGEVSLDIHVSYRYTPN